MECNDLKEANSQVQEATTLSYLRQSPHIVHFVEAILDQGELGSYDVYIIMEYCERGDLQQIIQRGEVPPEPVVRRWITCVLAGLAFVHGMRPPMVRYALASTTRSALTFSCHPRPIWM